MAKPEAKVPTQAQRAHECPGAHTWVCFDLRGIVVFAKTAGGVRCVRDSAGKLKVDGQVVLGVQEASRQGLETVQEGGWLYAVDLDAKK